MNDLGELKQPSCLKVNPKLDIQTNDHDAFKSMMAQFNVDFNMLLTFAKRT